MLNNKLKSPMLLSPLSIKIFTGKILLHISRIQKGSTIHQAVSPMSYFNILSTLLYTETSRPRMRYEPKSTL